MRLLPFLNRLRTQTKERSGQAAPDPLKAIVALIQSNPDTPQAQVLKRIVIGLRDHHAEFSESELFTLDFYSISLVDALVLDYVAGRYSADQLRRALEHTLSA